MSTETFWALLVRSVQKFSYCSFNLYFSLWAMLSMFYTLKSHFYILFCDCSVIFAHLSIRLFIFFLLIYSKSWKFFFLFLFWHSLCWDFEGRRWGGLCRNLLKRIKLESNLSFSISYLVINKYVSIIHLFHTFSSWH